MAFIQSEIAETFANRYGIVVQDDFNESQTDKLVLPNEQVLPAGFVIPVKEVECGCEAHIEKIALDKEYNTSACQLYELLFGCHCETFESMFDKVTGARSIHEY